jgi:probable DNA repair protein
MPLAEEGAAFLRWASTYKSWFRQQHAIDHARLADRLRALVLAGKAGLGESVILFGFDELNPQQRDLIDALASRGASVQTHPAPPGRCAAATLTAASLECEIRLSAQWARSRLSANPTARIAVVVPELTKLRSKVLRIFDEVLLPSAPLHPGEALVRPWNVSLGVALAQWPLVHAALLVLELARGELPVEHASVLLRSPFLGGGNAETDARALLDVRLRKIGDPMVSLDALERHAGEQREPHPCPQLAQNLSRLRIRAGNLKAEKQPLSFWGPALQSLVAAVAWPGERELDSAEYQAFTAWKELLCDLAPLDLFCGAVELQAAIAAVARLAHERVFQPESPAVPIQILGPLEAAQLEFDHLWVIGLTDEVWPRPARANPLLPIELQRSRALPRSSAHWELEFARRLKTGWEASAREVILSWHSSSDDRELSPSPLLHGLRGLDVEELGIDTFADWRELVYAGASIERLTDWRVSALPSDISVAGGARVLQDQAACAFRAFAAHRLRARPLEHPQEGLSARERGIVLHAALANLWGMLRSSAHLHAIAADELESVLRQAVARALDRLHPRARSVRQARFMELEGKRLCALLTEWLDLERTRPPFTAIANEQERHASVGGLELKLRLDRIDRLAAGDEMLIDYKSGETALSDWLSARPSEPQIPLYAITCPEPPSALAFARVARGESAFLGVASREGVAPGVQAFVPEKYNECSDWSQLIESWRTVLQDLAIAFRAGAVPVAPKKRAETCNLCDYAFFCRVSEVVDGASPVRVESPSE